jgi:formylglycine-generating enzyme required for sulfatase activity
MAGVTERPGVEPVPAPPQPAPAIQNPPPASVQSQAPVKKNFPILPAVIGGIVLLAVCGLCGFFGLRFLGNLPVQSQPATPVAEVWTSVPATDSPPEVENVVPTNAPATEAPVTAESSLTEEITQNNVPMRLIPAGEFTMGNDEGEAESRPAISIFVDTFYIDKFEVTNEMYDACVSEGKCRAPRLLGSSTRTSYYRMPSFADYPVLYVSWEMARAYCEWRDARLPTEAEWEKAARGVEDERPYPWGFTFDCAYANYPGCVGDTAAVNQYDKGQSPYGVYGMSGNVWEWTSSLDAFYPYNPEDGRENPGANGKRIVRGGSWNIFGGTGGHIRIDTRFAVDPVYYGAYIGIRCAMTP